MSAQQPPVDITVGRQASAGESTNAAANAEVVARSGPRGQTLILARAVWVVAALLALVMAVASMSTNYDFMLNVSALSVSNGWTQETARATLAQFGLTIESIAAYRLALEAFFVLVFFVVAAVIFWRKSNDLLAMFFSLFLLAFGVNWITDQDKMPANLSVPVAFLDFLAWLSFLIFFFIFPDGRFIPRWTRVLALFLPVVWLLDKLLIISAPSTVLVFMVLLGASTSAQVYRYRRASGQIQRQQTKWVVFGFVSAYLALFLLVLVGGIFPSLTQPGTPGLFYELAGVTLSNLLFLSIPISIGISIQRYRLWDIDQLISRTLVNVPLTGILAGVYAASIAFLQKLFTAVTGEKSDAAIVITTLILAAVFTPIKNALQSFVDKRFKEAPDPAKELKAFDQQVQAVVEVLDMEQITQGLLEKATIAFQAAGGAVYLMRGGQQQLVGASDGWSGNAAITLSLESGDERLGLLQLGARRNGMEYTPQDRETLQQTVDRVAHVISLQRSAFSALHRE